MDLDALVPAAFAARRVGVSRQLLNHWRNSGALAVADTRNGKPLYRLGDVMQVERDKRRSPLSHRAG